MRRAVASLMLLLVAVAHAPMPAQALGFSVFQDILPFGITSEPISLFLTGLALLSLAQLGQRRTS